MQPVEKLNSIYRGVVEDNNDPKKAGRCKIRIIGLHTNKKTSDLTSGVPTEELIWAQPCAPIFGGASGVGISGVPSQGAHVFIFFENGNIQQPRFFATAPGIPLTPSTPKYGFNDPSGEFPKIGGEPDWYSEKKTSSSYIDTFTITDKGGNVIKLGSKSGNESISMTNGATQEETCSNKNGTTNDAENLRLATKDLKIVSSKDFSQNASGKFIGSYGSVMESVVGDKKVIVGGASDKCISGIENKTCAGMNWEVKGNGSIMVAKEASYISDKETLIKSNKDNIKMEATMKNIEMKAQIGTLKGESLMVDISATTTAKFKGTMMTTIGDGSMITQIKGQIIMIG